jgi:tRNA dimethylallyltransferase
VEEQKKLIVIVGPTAAGKTALAMQLAAHYHAEIVSADSRQVFREMTIGTAKPDPEQLATVRHHFINSRSIHTPYDAAEYGAEALNCIHTLFQNCRHVILCGGSGMYIRAVCEGLDDMPDVPGEIREQLIANYKGKGIEALQEQMKTLDPLHYENIDIKNPQRLMRALEVILATGRSITFFQKKKRIQHDFNIIKIGIDYPREDLYKRIDARMDEMIAAGLFEEAAQLYAHKNLNALQTVGYQEIFDFMDGMYDRDETVRLLKRNSRRYAKRQMTWFKRDPDVHWVCGPELNTIIQLVDSVPIA